MKKTRILYVKNGNFKKGGVETFISNYYKELIKSNFEIDFLIHSDSPPEETSEIDFFKKNGSKIFYTPTRSNNILKHLKIVKLVLKNNHYDIVHAHTGSSAFLTLLQAQLQSVPIRIVHSHGTKQVGYVNKSIKNIIGTKILDLSKMLLKFPATEYAACSNLAGEYLFGKNSQKRVNFIKNAIDAETFKFSKENREYNRTKFNVDEDTLLLGQIGRFDINKNQIFTLEILEKLLNEGIKVKLIFIGEGETLEDILFEINKRNLSSKIILIDKTDQVYKVMSAIDVLLLPSHHEGLPLVTIEAQANGLPTIVSDNVSDEVILSDFIKQLPLTDKEKWISVLKDKSFTKNIREQGRDVIIKSGYNIKENGVLLSNWYEELIKGIVR